VARRAAAATGRLTRRGRLALLAAPLVALVPATPASAHGLVGRSDLPIPEWLFGWAAALVLVASFVALAALWTTPKLEPVKARPLVRVPVIAEVLCAGVGVALFVGLIYAGLAGQQSATENALPTFVFVVFWVGLVPASVVLGDVFRAFNPWRAVGRLTGWLLHRFGSNTLPEPLEYPGRLGRWPAVAGLVAFGWVELVSGFSAQSDVLAALAIAYATMQFVGMSLFGVEAWVQRGDTFAVYFGMFARMAPFAVAAGRLEVRPPLAGLTVEPPVRGTASFLCAAIGVTAFDGAAQGAVWGSVGESLQQGVADLGFDAATAFKVSQTVGLLLTIGLIALIWRMGIAGVRSATTEGRRLALSERFAHSLVPIACAYVLAHYASLLVFQGQAVAALLSDPLGNGSDLFGTAYATIDYTVLSASGFWYIQVGALVVGHVAALVLAHDRALTIFPAPQEAVRSQYWMLAVMVGFTTLGLWLLAQANA